MDPNSGKLYETTEAARMAGVENPVELIGRREDVERISEAVKAQKRAKRRGAEESAEGEPMTENIPALIAEARRFDTEPAEYGMRLKGAHDLIARLADALESLSAPGGDDSTLAIAQDVLRGFGSLPLGRVVRRGSGGIS